MGGRGAMPGATPSLPSNAGQSRSIQVFAGVCDLGVRLLYPPRRYLRISQMRSSIEFGGERLLKKTSGS